MILFLTAKLRSMIFTDWTKGKNFGTKGKNVTLGGRFDNSSKMQQIKNPASVLKTQAGF
jgi:hypothetical protein